MRTVAAVFADFERTALGGPAALLEKLAGRALLERSLARLELLEGLDARYLVVQPRDQAVAAEVLHQAGLSRKYALLPRDDGRRRRGELIRAARKWNIESWRGSVLGTTYFDEFVEPALVAAVMRAAGADAVLCLDGHMPLLDPAIGGAMLERQREYDGELGLVFTQAPPGLAGVLIGRETVRQLLEQDIPLGILLSYRPETPRLDPIYHPQCVHVADVVARTAARFTGDTRRSRALLAAGIGAMGESASAREWCEWLGSAERSGPGFLPVEVELEITTDDPLPESTLRPRGARVPRRQLCDLEAVRRVAAELAMYDDTRVVLGGFGDPLLHPCVNEVCRVLREAGITALAIVTPLVQLSDAARATVFDCPADLLQVQLDADSVETYARVHGIDRFNDVVANIERVEKQRRERVAARPLVVPSLMRCAATAHEVESFFDRWIRTCGWAVIEGYNNYCGALPCDGLLATVPPLRGACRRLNRRTMLLADGAAVICSQDYAGGHVIGNWYSEPISEIWRGAALEEVRRLQDTWQVEQVRPCKECTEWFRP